MSWKTGGGGVLLDTSHEINYMQYIFGEISDVSGFYGTVSDLEITSDDMSLINCRFKNGIYGHIHLDLLQFEASRTCKVIGTEGVCVMDLMKRTISISKKDDEEWKTEAFDFDFNELYDTEMTTFGKPVQAIQRQSFQPIMHERRWTLLKLFGDPIPLVLTCACHSMADGYDRGHTGESGFKTGP